MRQTSRCFIVCSSPHMHVVCPSSLNPHFSYWLCIVESLSGGDLGLTKWPMPHSNLEAAIPWDWMRACVVLSGDGWPGGSIFECGRCHEGVQQAVMRLSVGYVGAIQHNRYRSSTLVGLRHPEMALQAVSRTGSILEACVDLLQTGDAYSEEEKHRARAVVRIVLAYVPQLVFASFLRILFMAPGFALVLATWSLYVRHRSRVTSR